MHSAQAQHSHAIVTAQRHSIPVERAVVAGLAARREHQVVRDVVAAAEAVVGVDARAGPGDEDQS